MEHSAVNSSLATWLIVMRQTGVASVARGPMRFVALVWGAIIGFGLIMTPNWAAAADSLGEVQLSLRQTDPGGIAPSSRPRLAVILIDCSSSMTYGVNGDEHLPKGPSNPERWGEMKNGVRSTLEQLLTDSKGIEIRIRFFADALDGSMIRGTLDGPESVKSLMAELDKRRPEGTTVLYKATSEVCQQIIESNRKNRYEWILFGIFSDGKDGTSPAPHTAITRDAKVAELLADARTLEGQFEYLVFTVGPDAKGDYGQAQIKKLNERIPKPPQRPASYVLELAADQPKFLEVRQPAKSGKYSLGLSIADENNAIPQRGMKLKAGLGTTSPIRLVAQEFVVHRGMPASVMLELPAGTDTAQGLSAEITFEPALDASLPFACSGTPQFRLAFPADELLPPAKWQDNFPRAVKRNEPVTFFLDPGKGTNFTWRFTGPGGSLPPEAPREKQFERKFDTAGTWAVEYSCTSQVDTTKVVSKRLHDLEVVDADFHLEPEKLTVDPGVNATIRIVPNPGATSKAIYKADLDDAPLPVDGNQVTVPENLLRDNSHYLTVTASVEAGGRTFDFAPQKKVIKVKRAKIVRLKQGQTSPKPGDKSLSTPESLSPGVESAFQIENVDTGKVSSIGWNYTTPEGKTVSSQGSFLRLTPEACGTLIINATVTMNDGNTIQLLENFNVGGVPPSARPKLAPDVTAIGLLGTSVKLEPGIEGTCREARAWLLAEGDNDTILWEQTFDPRVKQLQIVVPPKLNAGRFRVHLSAAGYSGCEPWKELAPLTLTLTPRRKYELWLLSVAAMGGLGWLLYRWLWHNDPLRWWIDFSFTDPGPPTADSGGSYSLYVGDPTPAAAGHRTNYLGWNRWRKQSFVPLWLFAERADSADGAWLNDLRWAETTLKLVNVWKNPFKLTGDLAVNWKSEVRYNDLEGAEPISRTLWLQPPWDGTGDPPAVWMRMHCPRGGDPHLWFLWVWLAITMIVAALLLPYFNIVTL